MTGVQTCALPIRSEEHTSELQSHSEISYAVFCLKKKKYNSGRTARSQTRGNIQAEYAVLQLLHRLDDDQQTIRYAFFFFNDTATTEIYTLSYTLSLHDALPI